MKNSLRSAAVAAAMLGAIFGIGCSAQADQTTDKLKSTLQERMGDATIKSV
jgi:thiol:disulfide interchange protein DsbC